MIFVLIEQCKRGIGRMEICHNGQVDKDAALQASPLQPHIQAIHEQLVQQNQYLERQRQEVIVFLKTIWNAHAAKEPRQGAHGWILSRYVGPNGHSKRELTSSHSTGTLSSTSVRIFVPIDAYTHIYIYIYMVQR